MTAAVHDTSGLRRVPNGGAAPALAAHRDRSIPPGDGSRASGRSVMNDSERKSEQTGAQAPEQPAVPAARPREIGGPPGPEPTRYGDWERNGRCIDF